MVKSKLGNIENQLSPDSGSILLKIPPSRIEPEEKAKGLQYKIGSSRS